MNVWQRCDHSRTAGAGSRGLRTLCAFLSAASLCWLPLGRAQEAGPGNQLEPVVVTASRVAQSVADTLPDTSLITREDIQNSQATDVLTLLRREAGIEIAQNGGQGGQASIFMRGFNSNQTLVLIDGIPVNALESGGASLQHVMLDQIDHIEIVRGNVSALYGSQAVGGVIQIFTRSGGGADGVAIDAQVGGDRTRNYSVAAAGTVGEAGVQTHAALSASTNGSGGFSAIDAGIAPFANPNQNPYQSSSFSAQISQQIGASDIGVRLYGTRGRLSYDDPTDYSFLVPTYNGRIQTNEEHSELSTGLLFANLHLADWWSAAFTLGSTIDRSANTASFPESFDIGTTISRSTDISWNNVFTLDTQNKLTAGLEQVDQTGVSTAYAAQFTRRVDSGLLGYVGELGPNQLQANLRSDHYSDFGSAESGLLGYGYRFLEHFKAIAELATAFDAPTFDDLYYPGASNPHLRPEKSRSAELGLAYEAATTSLRLTAFRSTVHDLIAFDPVSFLPMNIDTAHLQGLELSGRTNWQQFELYGNLTLQRPIDVATDQLLLRRATHNLNLGAARAFGPWRLSVDVEGAGARFDSDINTFERVQLPGYTIANLVARYQVNATTTVSATLSNVFDRHYELVDGYNTPGRVFLVGVAVRL